MITFHLESDSDPDATINAIKSHGVKVGIALRPKTPAEAAFPYLDKVDMLLVMTVEPGFGGQSFIENTYDKVKKIAEYIGNRNIILSVDGGVGMGNVRKLEECGVTCVVAGSSVFKADDRQKMIKDLRGE